MAEIDEIKSALQQWGGCPIFRAPGELLPSLQKELEALWVEFLEDFDVGPYYDCAMPGSLDVLDDVEYLRDALASWQGWGQRARDEFVTRQDAKLRSGRQSQASS